VDPAGSALAEAVEHGMRAAAEGARLRAAQRCLRESRMALDQRQLNATFTSRQTSPMHDAGEVHMPIHRHAAAYVLSLLCLVMFSMAVSVDADGRIELENRVARSRYEYLVRRSATMREMVNIIEATPAILVRIRALPGMRDASSHIAHGILRAEDDRIHAMLEFDTVHSGLLTQLEMLAHELAHVIEVVCLSRAIAEAGIRQVLLARGFSLGSSRSGATGIETPFAIAVGHQVLVEATTRARDAGSLQAMARQYNLGASCPDRAQPAVAPATLGSR
jgi:hypothetical protein